MSGRRGTFMCRLCHSTRVIERPNLVCGFCGSDFVEEISASMIHGALNSIPTPRARGEFSLMGFMEEPAELFYNSILNQIPSRAWLEIGSIASFTSDLMFGPTANVDFSRRNGTRAVNERTERERSIPSNEILFGSMDSLTPDPIFGRTIPIDVDFSHRNRTSSVNEPTELHTSIPREVMFDEYRLLLLDSLQRNGHLGQGRGRCALRSAIDEMPTVRINNKHVRDDSRCPICLDQFTLGTGARQMPCNHLFHSDCIIPWLERHNSCPVCRVQLPSGSRS